MLRAQQEEPACPVDVSRSGVKMSSRPDGAPDDAVAPVRRRVVPAGSIVIERAAPRRGGDDGGAMARRVLEALVVMTIAALVGAVLLLREAVAVQMVSIQFLDKQMVEAKVDIKEVRTDLRQFQGKFRGGGVAVDSYEHAGHDSNP
jgi:hypothetical protein